MHCGNLPRHGKLMSDSVAAKGGGACIITRTSLTMTLAFSCTVMVMDGMGSSSCTSTSIACCRQSAKSNINTNIH